jgi:hypothetical protein
MKKVLKIFLLVSASILIGCGGGGSNDSSSSQTQIGDEFIKIFSIANKAVPVNFEREVFSFEKYNDIYAYVNSLKNSIICEKGSINFIVEDENLSCGTYKIIGNSCYINGQLAFDGEGEVRLINIAGLGCYSSSSLALSDVSFSENILGKSVVYTEKKGFTKTYTGDDIAEYNIIGNGEVIVDNQTFKLNNFGVYISSYQKFIYNQGSISNGEYTLNFTDLGKETQIVNGKVIDYGYEIFYADSKYYGIINDTNNKVYVHDKNDDKISDDYNFLEVYYVKED